MNLLRDPWLPVVEKGAFRHAALREILCGESDCRISLGRDDMELAALQLAVCLTQAALPPADVQELRERVAAPLAGKAYDDAVADLSDWFDLNHAKQPFMQIRGVKAKESTAVQKLFVGLPVGKESPAFFNAVGEVAAACPSCASIALFNQASNCPSFGGGFKGALRGGAPVTTLISGDSLRKTIWFNVLSKQDTAKLVSDGSSKPVWVEQIRKGENLSVSRIGFPRGLFWQPARIELIWTRGVANCAACGVSCRDLCREFKTEKFDYELDNASVQWPHPHGPREWLLKDGQKSERFVSFRKKAPAWTQLSGFLLEHDLQEREGWVPAPVVVQYRKAFSGKRLDLVVGGYKNKQAKILERRHELVSLAAGWGENMDSVRECINRAIEIKGVLRKKAWGFGKEIFAGKRGPDLGSRSEERFYALSEKTIHETLREIDWREIGAVRQRLTNRLSDMAETIFEDISAPYRHYPKALRRYVKARQALRLELAELRRAA